MSNIRRVTINEIEKLQEIAKETFSETFSTINSKENMEKYLNEKLSIDVLTTELNNKYSEFFFAEVDHEIVGDLKINIGMAQTERQTEDSLEIERIYVLKKFQGKKIGQLLYQKSMDIAIHKNVKCVWLGVWEENYRAIGFYKKNGFIEFDKHVFVLGGDKQIDLMMKRELN